MLFGREDYNRRIVDKEGKIPEDEPVFMLRGQDPFAPELLLTWAMKLRISGGDPGMARDAESHAQRMIEWQKSHKIKTPDQIGEISEYKRSILSKIISLKEESDNGINVSYEEITDLINTYFESDNGFFTVIKSDLYPESRSIPTVAVTMDDVNKDSFDPNSLRKLLDSPVVIYASDNRFKILRMSL